MKIIHCADIHLDSSMKSNLNPLKAKERKAELLTTFREMVGYAATNKVNAIIIAGDLFDTRNVSATARKEVYNLIINNPGIDFYYLQGNHDNGSFMSGISEIPDNLMTFSNEWTSYILRGDSDIAITGIELSDDNRDCIYSTLSLDIQKYNIVVMHGQDVNYTAYSKKKGENINVSMLKNKAIDYLALGHVHAYMEKALDARGVYCYPGCLEGRGFDEEGEHGFVLLDFDEEKKTCTRRFVPFSKRRIWVIDVDISACMDDNDIERKVRSVFDANMISFNDLVELVLVGNVDIESEKDMIYLEKCFKNDFYYFKIKDKTGYAVDYMAYEHDISLKGEFIRTVMADELLTDEDKSEIIRYGFKALAGEEIE